MKKKVLVGMSGGVDSSVTALLLLQQGYDVVGVTFRLWTPELDESESSCCSIDDVNDARFVCNSLGIPHYVFNYKDLFREKVVDYFAAEYQAGRTPNPCIACNRFIKFGEFLIKARSMEFDYIATGHYARIIQDVETGRFFLKKGVYTEKDQSYVLYCLTQEQLAHTLMPLGEYSKTEVRKIAEENNLTVSRKPDSQDICFVPNGNYAEFLEKHLQKSCPKGNFVDINGNILGEHKGIWHYTVGQRKGLGIALGTPAFVKEIDPKTNTVTLVTGNDVYSESLVADRLNFIAFDKLTEPIEVSAKIRYAHTPAEAVLSPAENGRAFVRFKKPQRAITRGQAVVFYQDDIVLGGGTIV